MTRRGDCFCSWQRNVRNMSKLLWFFNGSPPYRFGLGVILIEFLFIYEWRQTIYNVSTDHSSSVLLKWFLILLRREGDLHLVYLRIALSLTFDCWRSCQICCYLSTGVIWPRYAICKHSKNEETCVFIKKLAYTKKNSQQTQGFLGDSVLLWPNSR